MRVKFWGTRGSIPTPGAGTVKYGGNTPCVEVINSKGARVILDAGTGIRSLGEELATLPVVPKRIDILFSHLHWDHIQGLPFFIPMYLPEVEIHLWGKGGKGISLDTMMDHQHHTAFFPVGRAFLSAELIFHLVNEGTFEIPGFEIGAIPVNHPGGGISYRIREGKKGVVYATDKEPVTDPESKMTPDSDFARFAHETDLLIHDAQYSEEEYINYRKGWGHTSFERAVQVAREAAVKRLALFHHDPSHNDQYLANQETILREANRDLELFAAEEGAVIDL